MKKKNIVLSAVLIAACGMFTGCSSDSEGDETPTVSSKTLDLTIVGSSEMTRSASTVGDEATVNNIVVAVVDSKTSAVNSVKEITTPKVGSTEVNEDAITYTTTNPIVYVVANVSSDNVKAFKAAKDLTAFKDVELNLDNTTGSTFGTPNTVADGQNSQFLPMNNALGVTPEAKDGNDLATVELTRDVARVSIDKISVDLTQGAFKDYTLTVDKVFMYGAQKTWTLGGAFSDLYQGWGNETYAADGDKVIGEQKTIGGETVGHEYLPYAAYLGSSDIATAVTADVPYTASHYYYVFPTGASKELRLVIKATLQNGTDNTKVTYYYPVVVNLAQKNFSVITENNTETTGDGNVSANKIYSIDATITGVGCNFADEIASNLDVTCTVKAWDTTLKQEVNF